ncbi:PREDICTED: kelch domain-containing protein 7A [Nanorana parkeri]|uniref:kelch domain-containing protein 7A n=1 Tax=Nanorana parkeri TaxID=125878 RepID=UPI000854CED2|nr:PREDICTED: kelch domain-containing protein 7A [Nanorana parkeri]
MINTVWESRAWQLDMQLIGKVVLSAAALFFLGLAYRFYKFRALEGSEESDINGPGLRSAEGDVLDSPQRDYADDESSTLRFRRVNSNLQNGLVTDPGRKDFADSSFGTHKVHVAAQEGFETADVICKDQNDYCREVTEELRNSSDPLQSHRHHGDDTTCQKDECDGVETDNKTQSEHCREDPEGREMLEKSELVNDYPEMVYKNMTAQSSIELSVSHQNKAKQELHRFSSTAEVQMQESMIAEDGKVLQTLVPGGLRRKIYDYRIESTSQSAVNTLDIGDVSPQSPLSIITSHLPTSEEEKETPKSLKDLVETTEDSSKGDNLTQVTILPKQHVASDSNTADGADAQQTRSSSNFSITSQSVTEEGTSEAEIYAPQPELTYIKRDLQTLEEREAMLPSGENTADHLSNKSPDQNRLQEQDFSGDINKKQQEGSQVTNTGGAASANLATLSSNIVDQNIGAALGKQRGPGAEEGASEAELTHIKTEEEHVPTPTSVENTGPGTYHVSLTSESSVSDIHIDLGNCYEVLCMAKKHNLETLKTAAYQIMSNDYLQVLQNPSIYGRLNAAERDLILEGRMKGRRHVVVADIDTQATSAAQNESRLSYYDRDNDVWHPLSQIPAEAVSRGSSMATMFNYLFVVLGCDGPGRQMKPSRHVLCYNPLTDSWKEISPLKEARPHCKLVALNGFLYAIGGECLHTVERYDPRQNRWAYIAPLPNDTFAVAHMATAYDDEIFVTGGTFRYMLLRYREREEVWKSTVVSGSKDRTTEMVASNNFLYRFDLNRSMGISVHRCNIRARIWYECATLAMPYPAPFQCAVVGSNIHCISRNFHMRFLDEDVSPKFIDTNLQTVPSPKGVLYPFVLVLPAKGAH